MKEHLHRCPEDEGDGGVHELGPAASERGTRDIWDAAKEGVLADVQVYLQENPSDLNKKRRSNGNMTPLHLASRGGHYDVAKFLICQGAAIDPLYHSFGATPLMLAAEKGHLSVLSLLIDEGAYINYQSKERRAPLHWAVVGNQLDAIKILVERGADRDIKDRERRTPLEFAKYLGCRTEIVHYLNDGDGDNAVAKGDTKDIWEAVEKGELPAVKFHYSADPGVVNKSHLFRSSPLQLAARRGHVDIARFLLSKGAALNPLNHCHDQTPLMLAANNGHLSVINLLLDHGADVDYANEAKTTALHCAVLGNKLAALKLLLERGADRNIQDFRKSAPLQLARSLENTAPIVNYLVSIKNTA